MGKVDSNLDFSTGAKGINHPTPTASGDLVPKSYADAIAAGLIPHAEVDTAVGTNVNLASPGATLDTVTMSAGMRVLLFGQSTPSQNGPWVWNGASSAMTRPTDFASGTTQQTGVSVFVASTGGANSNAVMTLITDSDTGIIVDTTSQAWSQTNGLADVTAGTGLAKTGNSIAIENGGVLLLTHGGTGASTASGARTNIGSPGKYAQDIGDGSTTTFAINHGLGTTDICDVIVIDKASGSKEYVDWSVTDSTHVSVGAFATAPAASGGSIPGGTGKRVIVTA